MSFSNPSWSVLEYLYYLSPPILVIIASFGLASLFQAKEEFHLAKEEICLAKEEFSLAKEEFSLAIKDFDYKVRRDSIQRAVELTQYYVKEIIPGLIEFNSFFNGSAYETETKKLNQEKFKNFDLIELRKIITENNSSESYEVVIPKMWRLLSETLKKGEERKDRNGLVNGAITYEFKLQDLLNNLEYFSMNFTSGIADKVTVYRALHQTYLGTVKNLYFPLACQNDQPEDKFYNNIIELYNEWNSSDCKNKQEFKKKNDEHEHAMRTLNPKMESLGTYV